MMKDNMSTVLLVLLICGIAYLAFFHKQDHDSVSELKHWFSSELSRIGDKLESDIEKDKQGHYPHGGKHSFQPRGSITYTLLDKNMSRFELSQFSELTLEDIRSTSGFGQLESIAKRLGFDVTLDEIEVEGDGVETWHELDEFVYDIPRYYTVTISGWSV